MKGAPRSRSSLCTGMMMTMVSPRREKKNINLSSSSSSTSSSSSSSSSSFMLWCVCFLTAVVTGVGAHAASKGGGGDVMRCACGHEVARGNDLVAMAAPDSERTFRYVPLGHHGDSVNATVSRLRNPHGYAFDLVTVAEASGATPVSHRPTSQATWFPGYAWQILTCEACNAHVGWRFTEEYGALAVMSRAKYKLGGGGGGGGGVGGVGGGGGRAMESDSFVGLALEKMRFARGDLTFAWSPDDEAFVAAAVSSSSSSSDSTTEDGFGDGDGRGVYSHHN